MKNSRTLLILLIVFVALVTLLFMQNNQPTTNLNADNSCSYCVFTDIQINDIQAIRLRSPETGQSFTIARDADGNWTAPDSSGTLNTSTAELIARTMIVLPFHRTIPLGASDDKAAYGFTPEGILAVDIVVSNGIHAVAVGYRTPTSDAYYALVDDRPDMYLLERSAVDFLIAALKTP
ncbi:MAG: hypothetical protein IT319_13800, partial [Anaerolineae bacterium]|nr:hypothetical protein [Anaerolineae bacterium]